PLGHAAVRLRRAARVQGEIQAPRLGSDLPLLSAGGIELGRHHRRPDRVFAGWALGARRADVATRPRHRHTRARGPSGALDASAITAREPGVVSVRGLPVGMGDLRYRGVRRPVSVERAVEPTACDRARDRDCARRRPHPVPGCVLRSSPTPYAVGPRGDPRRSDGAHGRDDPLVDRPRPSRFGGWLGNRRSTMEDAPVRFAPERNRCYYSSSMTLASMFRPGRLSLAALAAVILAAALARTACATPSTTFWAPSTPFVQPLGVLHVTYDTYFGSKA